MSVYLKLMKIQEEVKVPKNQYNSFGKYKFRNCEDILEGVKPVCFKNKCVLFVSDKIKHIDGRYYIEATATLVDCESGEKIIVTADAREEESKKGMDSSQVTGASSSYARKYALNGLFAIDDTKDSDATNKHDKEVKKQTDYKKEIVAMLIELYGKEEAQNKLEEHTAFKGKDGKEVPGVRETSRLSDARARATYGKLKEVYKENKGKEWESGK